MASSSSVIHISLLTIALLLAPCLCDNLKHGPLVLPIRKDPITNLFYTSVGIGTPRCEFNLVINLGGTNLWYDCDNHYNSSTYLPLPCGSKICPADGGCRTCSKGPFKTGCSKIFVCYSMLDNPFNGYSFGGDTGEDVLFISNTTFPGFISSCVNSDIFNHHLPLKGLPKTSKGILGLGRTQLALPAQLSSSYHLPSKFALCLPSSNKKGLGNLFLGGVPDSLPHQNASSSSSSKFFNSTRLIVNPFSEHPVSNPDSSPDYFIDVKSIKVAGEVLDFKQSLLSIDNSGNGGTKLSTADPFTVLHISIYKSLVRTFVRKAAAKKIKRVAAVAPFEACFDLSTIGRTSTGLDVPTIDLVLQENVEWTIYSGNSMVLVKKNVACLGFVDGGEFVRTAVAIGGNQLQDKLLVFDLASSKLSFSSSLLLHHTRCSHG